MKNILSIDDEPTMLRCLSRALHSRGYHIDVADDPDEGLKILRERDDICLALLDIKMPKKDGFQIYREMRQFRNIPVLFVTGFPNSFDAESKEVVEMWKNEFADGTTDIIYKPFDLDTLYSKVEGLIGEASDCVE